MHNSPAIRLKPVGIQTSGAGNSRFQLLVNDSAKKMKLRLCVSYIFLRRVIEEPTFGLTGDKFAF
jgi:hypothetical protein